MLFRRLAIAVTLCLAATACETQGSFKDLPKGVTLGVADPVKPVIRQDYKLNPDDILEVDVFDVASLHRTVQVAANGAINMPYVGDVPAAGLTARQLGEELQRRYGEKYLKNPQISVFVKQARADTVTVDGSVAAPGVFAIPDNMSLIKVIALAKGLDPVANPREVVIFRTVNNERVAGVFDLTKIRSGKAVDPPVYPNDMIVVAGSGARRTLRDIVGVTPIVSLLPLIVP
jgi:polysaccharide export outer membrane protein